MSTFNSTINERDNKITLFRGATFSQGDIKDKFIEGNYIFTSSYISTSLSEDKIKDFLIGSDTGNKCILKIEITVTEENARLVKDISNFSQFPQE